MDPGALRSEGHARRVAHAAAALARSGPVEALPGLRAALRAAEEGGPWAVAALADAVRQLEAQAALPRRAQPPADGAHRGVLPRAVRGDAADEEP